MDFINKDFQELFDLLLAANLDNDQKVEIMEMAMKIANKSYQQGIAAASKVAEDHLKFNSLTV